MQLRKNIINTKTNVDNTNSFKIKQSAKAFKILSDNLYSDKITAVIRELSCNAYDSHVDAGKRDASFDVHLPSYDEPYFSVRDYGVGMDHNQVMNLYTSYFDSDKTESNELIGALGLGSKSPFAYTDLFTVDVNHNKIKRLYSCFIGANGTPQISLMTEVETDESNGVEIKLSVDSKDFGKFFEKAVLVFKYFDTQPNVDYEGYQYHNFDVKFKGHLWMLVRTGNYNHKAIALQGNIAYPISDEFLTDLNNKHRFVINNDFIINFKLGDLDIAASREALSYDEITIKNIKKHLEKVYDSFVGKIIKKINEAPNLWSAKIDLKHIFENIQSGDYIKDITYKNELISDKIFVVKIEDIKGTTVISYRNHYGRCNREDLTKSGRKISIMPNEKVIFIIDNEGRKAISKCKHMSETIGGTAYLVSKANKALFKGLGNPVYKRSSTIELPKKAREINPKGKEAREKIFTPLVESSFHKYEAISYDDLDHSKKIYYVVTKRNHPYAEGIKVDPYNIYTQLEKMKTLKIIPEDVIVYGVPSWGVKYKKFMNSANFIEFSSFFKNKIKEVVKTKSKEIESYYINKADYKQINHNDRIYELSQKKDFSSMIESSEFFRIKDKYDEITKTYKAEEESEIKIIADAASMIGIKFNVNESKITKFEDVYPMLSFVDRWEIRSDYYKRFADYINLVDGNK